MEAYRSLELSSDGWKDVLGSDQHFETSCQVFSMRPGHGLGAVTADASTRSGPTEYTRFRLTPYSRSQCNSTNLCPTPSRPRVSFIFLVRDFFFGSPKMS